MSSRRSALIATTALALASAAGAADNYQYRPDRSDTLLARASVAHLADLGTGAGWRGGATQPDRSHPRTCLGYRPKRSDLIVTGDARSIFRYRNLMMLESRAQVFATAKMLETDWRRSALDPRIIACMRTGLADLVRSGGTLVSLTKLPLPHFAAHTSGWRAVVAVTTSRGTVDVVADLVLCADERTEVSLVQMAIITDAGTAQGMRVAEIRLARSLISRFEV